MDFSRIKFDASDIVKGFVLMGTLVTMWADLKTDQVQSKEDRKFLQYQIDEIKRTAYFTKPEPPSIKTYKVN